MAVIGFWDSLTQAQKVVDSELLAGVVEEIIKEGYLVNKFPVTQIDTQDLTYNRESTLPTAQFYDINEELTSQAVVTYTQETVSLKRCIGQYDLDRFIIRTYRDPNDMEAMAVSQARKGVGNFLEEKFIYGDNTTYPKEFDGLQNLMPAAQRFNAGSGVNCTSLSLAMLDEMMDAVRVGNGPSALLMNFELKRRFDALYRGGSANYPIFQAPISLDQMGEPIMYYRGVPIMRTDFITQTESISGGDFSASTGDDGTTLFAVNFGLLPAGGLGLVTGNPMLEFERIEPLENKDAVRFRLIWYLTMALGSTKAIACIDGITDSAIGV